MGVSKWKIYIKNRGENKVNKLLQRVTFYFYNFFMQTLAYNILGVEIVLGLYVELV